jgi:hypothetical protein
VVALFRACARDGAQWESESGCRLLVWAKTARPVVVRAFGKAFTHVEPRVDGSASDYARDVAMMARAHYQLAANDEHALLLRGASSARFRDSEWRAARDGEPYAPLFKQLGVDAARGDRLLIVARVPFVD